MGLNKDKTDSILGAKIEEYLRAKGVHTPMLPHPLTEEEQIKEIKDHFTAIMNILGLDLKDDSLKGTPRRVAKMYAREIFWGLKPENFPKCTTVNNKFQYDEMVTVKRISVKSNCEHHFVIIDGYASIAYIPDEKVLGLSKLNRIVEYFCRRPQIQERLTEQIFYALEFILGTSNVAVRIDATHYCVKARGVEDINSETVTTKLGGLFKEDASLRDEFLKTVQ